MVVDAHQLRDFEIVGGGAKGAPKRGAIEQQVEQQDHRDGGDQREQRNDADRKAAAELNRGGLDRAEPQPPAVGGKSLEQSVLNDDG